MSKLLSPVARELKATHRYKVIPKSDKVFVRDGTRYVSVHLGPGALERAKRHITNLINTAEVSDAQT